MISSVFILLHYACCLTISKPQVISVLSSDLRGIESDIQQTICYNSASKASDSIQGSTRAVTFVPEDPPRDLSVNFQYTRGGVMAKYDLWNMITYAISKAALLAWNEDIVGSMEFPVTSNVEIRIVSSVNPPRYQTKFVVWTLAEALDFYIEQRHYSNCFFTTQLGSGRTTQRLGVGSIKSTLSTVPGPQSNLSVLSLLNESSTSAFDTLNSNQSIGSDTDVSLSNLNIQSLTDIQANTGHLSLNLNWIVNGQKISDKDFYRIIVDILIYAAQQDPKQRPCDLITSYNSAENYTFQIGPTSAAASDKLPWNLVIPALGNLPTAMQSHSPESRWAELSGRIKLDGAYIGRLQILKGDHRDPQLGSCEMVGSDDGNNGNIAASL